MLPSRPLRVAFFPDSFHEVNGVAHTARQFTGWAARTNKPVLCVRAGFAGGFTEQGSLQMLELPRGFLSFALDKDLRYDPLFARHTPAILRALHAFQPDLVHITGPSELGMLGAVLAHRLGVPLAASWHTNVHEYAARRSGWALRALPSSYRLSASRRIEDAALWAAALFYRGARLLFAPNPSLCALLQQATDRPCLLMSRGIDATLFCPERRTAPPPRASGIWTLGYIGRLSVEKNVALLPRIASELRARGLRNFRFLIVGQGREETALRSALPEAIFLGVLRGEALADAYSNMDCFLFPSHTDTFGNVVLEAMAAGVPTIVTPDGGPAHIVRASQGGGYVADDREFASAVSALMTEPEQHRAMCLQARAYACRASWDQVFEGMYIAYGEQLFPRQADIFEQEKERL